MIDKNLVDLTNEDIISSLKVIATTRNCNECKIRNCKWGTCNCEQTTANAALDLINRQKAEIERLKECPKCVYEYDGEMTEYCIQGACSNFKTVEQIKTESYKEFAEKIKQEIKEACDNNIKVLNEHLEKYRGRFNDTFVGNVQVKNNALLGLSDFIGNILKELVGDKE